jgi:hypothetical protein
VFDLGSPRHLVGDGEILRAVAERSQMLGGVAFRMREWDRWAERPCEASTVVRRWGSWRLALAAAGVRGGRAKRYTAAELVENLERVWRELGRAPGAWAVRKHGEFSAETYVARWGSVRRACERVAAFHRGEITREELEAEVEPRRGGPVAGKGNVGRRGKGVRQGVSLEVRYRVMKRDRFRCVCCGASPASDPGVELEVDHILAVSQGGGSEESNLRTLCGRCNRGKGADAA